MIKFDLYFVVFGTTIHSIAADRTPTPEEAALILKLDYNPERDKIVIVKETNRIPVLSTAELFVNPEFRKIAGRSSNTDDPGDETSPKLGECAANAAAALCLFTDAHVDGLEACYVKDMATDMMHLCSAQDNPDAGERWSGAELLDEAVEWAAQEQG